MTCTVLVEEVHEVPRAMPRRHAPNRRIPFSVLLTAPLSAPTLLHGICTLKFDGLAVEGVYVKRIVPLEQYGGNAWYEIGFN